MNYAKVSVMNLALSFSSPQLLTGVVPVSKEDVENSKHLARLCALLALDKKATEVVVLEVGHLSSYADYFMLCSVGSERQAMAVAHHIQSELKVHGKTPIGLEGGDGGRWVLMDYGDVVCHIFLESSRQYYDLESFWLDAPKERF